MFNARCLLSVPKSASVWQWTACNPVAVTRHPKTKRFLELPGELWTLSLVEDGWLRGLFMMRTRWLFRGRCLRQQGG